MLVSPSSRCPTNSQVINLSQILGSNGPSVEEQSSTVSPSIPTALQCTYHAVGVTMQLALESSPKKKFGGQRAGTGI